MCDNEGLVLPLPFGKMFRWQCFPHLDKDVAFLNHGSYGSPPKQAKKAQLTRLAEYDRDPDLFRRMNVENYWIDCATKMAEYFGTADGNISLTESTTSGVNSLLKSIPLNGKTEECGTSDMILYNTWTHPMTKAAIKDRACKQNLTIIEMEYPYPIESKEQIISLYKLALKGFRQIKLVVIDMISSTPNIRWPIEELIPLCQENGAMVLIDAAHGVGQVPFQLNNTASGIQPDFLAGSCHKWMYTARGCGVLYVDPKYHDVIKPLMASFEFDQPFYRCFIQQGCRDECSMTEARAALDFVDWIGGYKGYSAGLTRIHDYIEPMVTKAASLLATAWGTHIMKIPKDMESPFIRCILMPNLKDYAKNTDDAAKLLQVLRTEHNIWATVFYLKGDEDEGELYMRICGQVYCADSDFENLKKVILGLKLLDIVPPAQKVTAPAPSPLLMVAPGAQQMAAARHGRCFHVGENTGIFDINIPGQYTHKKVSLKKQ